MGMQATEPERAVKFGTPGCLPENAYPEVRQFRYYLAQLHHSETLKQLDVVWNGETIEGVFHGCLTRFVPVTHPEYKPLQAAYNERKTQLEPAKKEITTAAA